MAQQINETMDLTILLPTETLFQGPVVKLTARAANGLFGVLPNHIDFVAALAPGILNATAPDGTDMYFGVDEGVFVKREREVNICVHRAVQGADLSRLSQVVRESFIEIDDRERRARAALARLEANVVRRFAELRDIRP
jgi:F-type H+-transporting ATPase subunit epsilon